METKKQQHRQFMRDRSFFTAGRMADWECPQCGSPGPEVSGRCNAPLEQACIGFLKIEECHRKFESLYDALKKDSTNG